MNKTELRSEPPLADNGRWAAEKTWNEKRMELKLKQQKLTMMTKEVDELLAGDFPGRIYVDKSLELLRLHDTTVREVAELELEVYGLKKEREENKVARLMTRKYSEILPLKRVGHGTLK
jgi:hypothetical protein